MANLDNTPNTENASLEQLADQITEAITRGHPKPLLRILRLCSRLLKPRQLALLKQIMKERQKCIQTQ